MNMKATGLPLQAVFIVIGIALMGLGITINIAFIGAGALFMIIGIAAVAKHKKAHSGRTLKATGLNKQNLKIRTRHCLTTRSSGPKSVRCAALVR